MNRILKSALALAVASFLLPVAHAQEGSVLARGHAFYASDFEAADALKDWPGAKATLEAGCKGGHALCIQRPAGSERGSSMVHKVLPVEKMRGYVVFFSAMIKAENVSQRPQPWNGVKFMAPMVTATGKSWPAAKIDIGTFDWQRAAFRVAVPEDAKELSLCLGLESVSGKAWFDDVRVTVGKRLPSFTPRTVTGPIYKGHDLPRLRGAMIRPTIDEASLRVLGQEWGANVLRWQLIRHRPVPDPLDMKAYDQWLQSALKPVIEFQKAYGVHIYIGEFSAIRWAPDNSAYRYLKDLIDIFEAHGWDWTYHAFREWDGWSVEHGPDRKDRSPSKTPTDREKLLREWFGKNVH